MYNPGANEDDYNQGWEDALDTIWGKINNLKNEEIDRVHLWELIHEERG